MSLADNDNDGEFCSRDEGDDLRDGDNHDDIIEVVAGDEHADEGRGDADTEELDDDDTYLQKVK